MRPREFAGWPLIAGGGVQASWGKEFSPSSLSPPPAALALGASNPTEPQTGHSGHARTDPGVLQLRVEALRLGA